MKTNQRKLCEHPYDPYCERCVSNTYNLSQEFIDTEPREIIDILDVMNDV